TKLQGSVDANAKAITDEATARTAADTKLQSSVDANAKAIDAEVTARDQAVAQERAERKGADAAQDKVIKQVNDNLVSSVDTINKNIGTITNQLNKNDLAEAQTRAAADQTLQKNIDVNADNINQNKQNIAGIQDTLNKAGALASAKATENATKAANDATAAAENANTVAKGLKDRVDLISNNQKLTSESDLIKKDHSIGQNLTDVDAALHKEIAARIGADKAQDEVIKKVNKNVADGFDTINQNVAAGFTALNQADANEATTRDAADQKLQGNIDAEAKNRADADAAETKARQDVDSQLNTKMTYGFATIQGQQDEQNAQIGKNQTDIHTNAGNIQKNTAEIKANSGKIADHEDRISSNTHNIEANANTIHKVQGDVVDNQNAISAEVLDRQAADQNLQTQINNNNTSVNNEAAERKAADQNLQNQINNNSTSINDLYGRYSSLKTDINKVGARSAALAGLHPLDFDPANKLNFAVASGSFKGENSVALGAFYRPNENIMFSAASTMGDSDNAYTFGLSFKIGPSSAKTKTTSPDAEELYKVVGELQDQLAAQQKEIEQLKADKAK
uniref:YadA C-terminal domain-containing protein n=1 Tax=Megasphaera sp. TaxID=2023260 RepID=UPI00258067FC